MGIGYTLPFKPTDKVLEVGGGDRPNFRPNLDIRPSPTVDIVADLNQPWPVDSEVYDGVFGMYIIEHISWRKVRQFISETHRVLRPSGMAVMVTANLLQQARKLVEIPEWNDNLVCMIFGDNDYSENTHRCGFSPAYAIKLFREAGFHEVTIYEHPNCKTDMIIQAQKSGAVIARSL
jgi:predicted SAM-dependent methyltransferase